MPPIQIEFCRHVRVISALRYTGCQLSCMRSGGDCQEAAELACYHFKPTDGIPDPLYQFTWKVRILGSSPRVQLTERSQYRTMDVLVINGIIGECTRWSNLTRPQTIPIRLHRRPPPLVTLESSVHTSLSCPPRTPTPIPAPRPAPPAPARTRTTTVVMVTRSFGPCSTY
jgi:hypothetical protein